MQEVAFDYSMITNTIRAFAILALSLANSLAIFAKTDRQEGCRCCLAI